MTTINYTYQLDPSDLNFSTKLLLCLEFPLMQVGIGLFIVIIYFESFGGDPMKRSLLNMLVSALCFSTLTTSFFSSTSLFLRAVFGGLGVHFSHIVVLATIFWLQMMGFNILGIFTFKSIQILKPNFANRLDEAFLFWSAEIFGLILASILTLLESAVAEKLTPIGQVLAGNQPWQSKSMFRILFGYIYGDVCSLLIYSLLSIWKKLTNNDVEPQAQLPHPLGFNVMTHNPRILNDLQYLFVALMIVLFAIFPFVMTGGLPPDTSDELVMLWMPMRISIGLVSPILFFCFNQDLRAYCKREFWDMAPECLQYYNPNLVTIMEID